MTNNEAIEILNALAWVQGGPDREETITAISMAIEALSAETKIKCIAQIKVDTEEIVRRIKEECGLMDTVTSCTKEMKINDE